MQPRSLPVAISRHTDNKTPLFDAEAADDGTAFCYSQTGRKLALVIALGVLAWTLALAPFFLWV